MLASTVANTACDTALDTPLDTPLGTSHDTPRDAEHGMPLPASHDTPRDTPLEAAIRRMTAQSIPNLLRLHLSPHVAQACYLLDRLAARWRTPTPANSSRQRGFHGAYQAQVSQAIETEPAAEADTNAKSAATRETTEAAEATEAREATAAAGQVFLANSGEEALSGAIKLARTVAAEQGDGRGTVIYDPAGRFRHFSETLVDSGTRVVFLPEVVRCETPAQFWQELERMRETLVGSLPAGSASSDPRRSFGRSIAHSRGRLGTLVVPVAELPRLLEDRRARRATMPIASMDCDVARWNWILVASRSDVEQFERPVNSSDSRGAAAGTVASRPASQLEARPASEPAPQSASQFAAAPQALSQSESQFPSVLPALSQPTSVPEPLPAADIVVFDESFVERDVPFGAFAASREWFRVWSGPRMATFHSTTYQPNALSNMRLVDSLRHGCPEFHARHASVLERLDRDAEFRYATLRALYSRSLARLASALGLRHGRIEAAGHYYAARGQRVFDGVAGVACSVRGHNPPGFVDECRELGPSGACRAELRERLEALTGLPRWIPAVSGASAVEHALRIGLTAQSPRDWVLALRGGFGGKTLFALAGTWKPSLKRGLDPLYPHVVYVDAFAPDAVTAVRRAFDAYPIGIAQFELIQGVGGVRETPVPVLRTLEEMREQHGCLLSVDEVQTGMFRTGPFLRATTVGVRPDLLTLGKGASDMIFPFALTLVSRAVEQRLRERGSSILDDLTTRCDYEMGVRSVLGTLRRAADANLEAQVTRQANRLAERLHQRLLGKSGVRAVRCFGLLIGIELETSGLARRLLARRVPQLYLLELLREHRFPLLVGFCQYEPHVLKLTPPLSITDAEIDDASRTLAEVLTRSLPRVLGGFVKNAISRVVNRER